MAKAVSKILDQYGKPLTTLQRVNNMQPQATLGGGGITPYEGGQFFNDQDQQWFTWLWSPDAETNPARDIIVARLRDLVRNDGWANGIVSAMLDNVIGSNFRLIAQPDYTALAEVSGNSGFDSKWADDFRQAAEAQWRTWADDPNRWCDHERRLTVTQMMYLALRHKLIDGDCVSLIHWQPEDVMPGRARYATRFQLIDPDLLCNPQVQPDSQFFRGGVEIDVAGVTQAYHFRRTHPGNYWAAGESFVWDRVERETPWGRPRVLHDFDSLRAGQHRGSVGVLTPVLLRFKMLNQYDRAELQAAVLQATMPMFVESPYDPQLVEGAMIGASDVESYNDIRMGFHERKRLKIANAVIPMLFPGEKIGAIDTNRPNSNFAQFEHAVLRSISAVTGLSAEQVTHDYSQTNYSSNRAAMIEAWKTLTRRRHEFVAGFARPLYGCWLEEAMSKNELPLPAGDVPSYGEMRAAYSACQFIGPAKGHVDPTKEVQASILALDAGITTLKAVCAEQGLDWEEVLEQRAIENDKIEELGITPMAWTGNGLMPDSQAPGGSADSDEPDQGSGVVPAKKTVVVPEPA